MHDATAKIVRIDTSKIAATLATRDTPDGSAWHGVSEASYIVEVCHNNQTYARKITFRIHDEKVHHIGGVLTVEDVQRAIMAEVDQITSLHAVAAAMAVDVDVDLVAKLATP